MHLMPGKRGIGSRHRNDGRCRHRFCLQKDLPGSILLLHLLLCLTTTSLPMLVHAFPFHPASASRLFQRATLRARYWAPWSASTRPLTPAFSFPPGGYAGRGGAKGRAGGNDKGKDGGKVGREGGYAYSGRAPRGGGREDGHEAGN